MIKFLVFYYTWFWIYMTGLVYHRRFQYVKRHKIDKSRPTLIAGNHQNAFLDPMVIGEYLKMRVGFLVRADVFKSKIAAKILGLWEMMPVYRQRDGVENLGKNEDTFENCYDMLRRKHAVIMFPEGNQMLKKVIRPIQKGLVRIAFGAVEKYPETKSLQILPAGVDYKRYKGLRKDLLVVYGEPIFLEDYWDAYKENPAKVINELKLEVRNRMKDVTLNYNNDDTYPEMHRIGDIIMEEAGGTLYENWTEAKARTTTIKKVMAADGTCEVYEKSKELGVELDKSGVSLDELSLSREKTKTGRFLLNLVLLPLILLGIVIHWGPKKYIDNMISKIKDANWHGSINYAGLMFLVPIVYGLGVVVALIAGASWMWIGIGVAVAFASLFALSQSLDSMDRWNASRKVNGTSNKEKMNELFDAVYVASNVKEVPSQLETVS